MYVDNAMVTINGLALSRGEVMTLRVALTSFDCDCGDDEHGKAMTKAYGMHRGILLGLLLGTRSAPEPGEKP